MSFYFRHWILCSYTFPSVTQLLDHGYNVLLCFFIVFDSLQQKTSKFPATIMEYLHQLFAVHWYCFYISSFHSAWNQSCTKIYSLVHCGCSVDTVLCIETSDVGHCWIKCQSFYINLSAEMPTKCGQDFIFRWFWDTLEYFIIMSHQEEQCSRERSSEVLAKNEKAFSFNSIKTLYSTLPWMCSLESASPLLCMQHALVPAAGQTYFTRHNQKVWPMDFDI